MRKTKIIATLGPATNDINILREVVRAGVNVARINFSHANYDDVKIRLANLRQVCEELNCTVGTLADTKGPEIRLCAFEGGKATLVAGEPFILTTEQCDGNHQKASITYQDLPKDIEVGTTILLDDGLIELRVEDISKTEIKTRIINGGDISNNKGVNVPSTHLNLPFISSKDRADLHFCVDMDFDFVAASFTRNKADLLNLREVLHSFGGDNIQIIAKIENAEGVENIREIVEASDGIMVARGDLGVEMPLEDIPALQKQMIKLAYRQGKPVITATQMLESMIHSPKPTRAEVSDVANAIYDGTSAIMLSGETAAGMYPVEAVQMMSTIAERTEQNIHYKTRFQESAFWRDVTVVNAVSHATVSMAHDLEATAILTVTVSGDTARNVSKFRPICPIITCTTEPKVMRQLCLVWGTVPLLLAKQYDTNSLFEQAIAMAQKGVDLKDGDLIVVTAGVPLGQSGTTNMMKVQEIGKSAKIL